MFCYRPRVYGLIGLTVIAVVFLAVLVDLIRQLVG